LEVTRAVYRFVNYTTRQDPTVEPEYSAECVAGDEQPCGATSGTHAHPTDVEDWMRTHLKETRHRHFRRRIDDFAELVPTDGPPDGLPNSLPDGLEPAKVDRVTP
jgi:hypothetical protein